MLEDQFDMLPQRILLVLKNQVDAINQMQISLNHHLVDSYIIEVDRYLNNYLDN